MKTKLTSAFILFFLFSLCVSAQQQPRDCRKRIKITGELANGNGSKVIIISVVKRFYDFTEEQRAAQLAGDKDRYNGFGYEYMSPPTMKMDCAGNTLKELFNTGEYWVGAEKFYDSLIVPYAKQISNFDSWGDAQEGDVAVYFLEGKPMHITYVSRVEATRVGANSITVITKDGKEGTYLHKLTKPSSLNDPLEAAMGEPVVYRFNHETMDVNDGAFPDCNGMTDVVAPANSYSLKQVIADKENVGYKPKNITESECTVTSETSNGKKDNYSFKLITKPPQNIVPGETFPLTVSGTCSGAEWDYNVWVRWNGDNGFQKNQTADKYCTIGLNDETKKFTPSATVDMTVTVPAYSGNELIFSLRIVYATAFEASGYEWVRFVYQKK